MFRALAYCGDGQWFKAHLRRGSMLSHCSSISVQAFCRNPVELEAKRTITVHPTSSADAGF